VAPGAVVEDSIIFHRGKVSSGSMIYKVICDKGSLSKKMCTWVIGRAEPNMTKPNSLSSGVTIIGRKATIPAGTKIGSNCIVANRQTDKRLPRDIPDGQTVITGSALLL